MWNAFLGSEGSDEPMKIIRAWMGDNPSRHLGLGPIRVIQTDEVEIHLWLGNNIIPLPNRMPNKDEEMTFLLQDQAFGVDRLVVTVLNQLYSSPGFAPQASHETVI